MNSFEDWMKKHDLGDALEKSEALGAKSEQSANVYIARFIDKEGDATAIEEFGTKEEYDAWYKSIGEAIEMDEGGKITMDFGPSEIKREDAEITGVYQGSKPEDLKAFIEKTESGKAQEKEKVTYIISGSDMKGEPLKELIQSDDIDEVVAWYYSLGQLILEQGGELQISYRHIKQAP